MAGAVFDKHNPNWSTMNGHNYFFLEAVEKYANTALRKNGFITLNGVYEILGLDQTEEGALAGWVGDVEIDFGVSGGIGGETPIELNFNTNSNNVFRDKK
jgi:hypothetical protein